MGIRDVLGHLVRIILLRESQGPRLILRALFLDENRVFGALSGLYIFDDVRFDQTNNQGFYFIDSEENHFQAPSRWCLLDVSARMTRPCAPE